MLRIFLASRIFTEVRVLVLWARQCTRKRRFVQTFSHALFDQVRKDFHINGNALYCMGDRAFDQYRLRVQKYYNLSFPGSRTGAHPEEDGYDHAMFQFRYQLANYEYASNIMHKFRYVEWIANFCEGRVPFNPGPAVFLGHSKFDYFDAINKYIFHAFPGVFNRFPSGDEIKKLKPLVQAALAGTPVLWPSRMGKLVLSGFLLKRDASPAQVISCAGQSLQKTHRLHLNARGPTGTRAGCTCGRQTCTHRPSRATWAYFLISAL